MDKNVIIENVTVDVNEKLLQNNLSKPPDFLYEWIIDALLVNNKIMPIVTSVDYSHAEKLSEVLQQWIFDNEGNPITIDSNVTSQILQQLTQEGWTLIPPQ